MSNRGMRRRISQEERGRSEGLLPAFGNLGLVAATAATLVTVATSGSWAPQVLGLASGSSAVSSVDDAPAAGAKDYTDKYAGGYLTDEEPQPTGGETQVADGAKDVAAPSAAQKKKAAEAAFTLAAIRVRAYGLNKSAVFAGQVSDPAKREIVVYRRPVDGFDDAARKIADGRAALVFRDARYSRVQMKEIRDEVEAFSAARGLLVEGTASNVDGSGVTVTVEQGFRRAKALLRQAFGSNVEVDRTD